MKTNNIEMRVFLFQKRKQSTPIFAKMQQISRLLLTTPNRSPYSVLAFAKSEAFGRDNSKNRHTANNSAPCAFFIRSLRTPKERPFEACSSMVACSGKGFALCCVPYVAVCHPVARYRPLTVTSDAIAPINFHTELSAMIYKFLLLGEKRLTVRIRATSEADARKQLNLSKNALCIARLNAKGVNYA